MKYGTRGLSLVHSLELNEPDRPLSVTSFVAHVCCGLKKWLKDADLCLTNVAFLLLYDEFECTTF